MLDGYSLAGPTDTKVANGQIVEKVHENIGWFDITMDDSFSVNVVEPFEDLIDPLADLADSFGYRDAWTGKGNVGKGRLLFDSLDGMELSHSSLEVSSSVEPHDDAHELSGIREACITLGRETIRGTGPHCRVS